MSLTKITEISNKYGANPEFVLAGGGNTSYKDAKFLSPKQIQKMYNMEKHNGDKFRKEMKKRQGMKKQHDGRRHMSQGDVKK